MYPVLGEVISEHTLIARVHFIIEIGYLIYTSMLISKYLLHKLRIVFAITGYNLRMVALSFWLKSTAFDYDDDDDGHRCLRVSSSWPK